MPDAVTVAMIATIPSFLTFVATLLATRATFQKSFGEQIDDRVKTILDERDKRVAELEQKLDAVQTTLQTLVVAIRDMARAGHECHIAEEKPCPVLDMGASSGAFVAAMMNRQVFAMKGEPRENQGQ